MSKKLKTFAKVTWCVMDIHSHREVMEYSKWTDKQASKWLKQNERIIEDLMVERGWSAIEDLMEK